MALLEQDFFDPIRGDVIVFNNTSAEHPATYDFVRKCTEYTERTYRIPFFWIEHASYEDASHGEWVRSSTFRLVNREPLSKDNPNGYHWQGEVFEELVSQLGFLPSRHTRTCTANLKLLATNKFLAEWFASKDSIERRGHYYHRSMITDDEIIARHRKSRGKMTDAELLRKKQYVRMCPPARLEQNFADYSEIGSKHLVGTALAGHSLGDCAEMTGANAIEYVSLIGLRSDEPLRVSRVKKRNMLEDKERGKLQMPDGEIVYTPLSDAGIGKREVKNFWGNRPFQLDLPDNSNLSNCVYCFMKGANAIPAIHHNMKSVDKTLPSKLQSVAGTPSDINWWVDLEKRYQRHPEKRHKGRGRPSNKRVVVGFWGVDAKESYDLLKKVKRKELVTSMEAMPCDCTE